MKKEKNYRFFCKKNEEWDTEKFEYGRTLVERIPTDEICTEYYIGGLYDKEEVDEWKDNGADPDDMPLPVADESSWESTYEEEKEFYELVDGNFVIVTAGSQNEGQVHCWWDGSNHQEERIYEPGGLAEPFIIELDIESFENIWDNSTGNGQGHDEVWKAVNENSETEYYYRPVSYWQGVYNEYYYKITEEEAKEMMK